MSREELDALAENIAERLGVDPETVMTEPPNRLSLTIQQVRGIMAPSTPVPKPSLELDRADDGSAFIGVTYFDEMGVTVRSSVLSHAYGVAADKVMKRKFEQMLELMGDNVDNEVTEAFAAGAADKADSVKLPDGALTPAERKHIEFYNGYGVAVDWFVGHRRDNGDVEVLAVGHDRDDDEGRGFVWSLLINGDECTTSEAPLGPFTTGLEI